MENTLYVAGIGASAGGLEAIHEFFDQVPEDPKVAFVIVQHLSSDHKSLLVELVSKHTHMQVMEASDDLKVKAACVYVIPNNKLMTIKNGRLHLSKKDVKGPNTAIDHFFVSLGMDKKEHAIGVILSGTGTDGTQGISVIKDNGGLVIVQDPKTAKFDGMPLSAGTSGNADFIVPTSEIYEKIAAFVNHDDILINDLSLTDDPVLERIFQLVDDQTSHDFTLYKTPTLLRRISRRMQAVNTKSIDEYYRLIKSDERELEALGKDFLIGVTRFFRDEGAYQVIKHQVIPHLVNNKQDGELFKVWVCACSTGEEAYSIAILIDDYLSSRNRQLDVKIFASDLDETSIEIAGKNSFSESVFKHIPEDLAKRYFTHDGNRFSVIPHIRKQIVFAKHNVIKAPPFIKNDLVSCRNMLIYMNSVLQQKVLATLHFSLNANGYLFLGPSEAIAPIREGVTDINSKWKIYQKTGPVTRPSSFTYGERSNLLKNDTSSFRQKTKKTADEQLQSFLIKQHGYVAVFIDRNFEVKETIGDYKRFLSLPDLKLEINILKMVPKELSFILNNAIRNVWKEQTIRSLKKVRMKSGKADIYVNIDISPVDEDAAKIYTLIVFNQVSVDPDSTSYLLPVAGDEQYNGYVMELESELSDVRQNLQLAIEEMETSNEELQSSNEELLSANEELQSSNEELQSLNEELHTLNAEHQQKIKELTDLNDDLNNYFKSVDIAQIFVDANGRIRKFNPAAIAMVNLIEADIGRPISHISNNIRDDHFLDDIHHALIQQIGYEEKEVELKSGRICLMRILPYTRLDNVTDGVVITFIDVSALNELNNIIAGVFKTSLSAVLVFKAIRDTQGKVKDFQCLAANAMAQKIVGSQHAELSGLLLQKQLPELLQGDLLNDLIKLIDTGSNLNTEIDLDDRGWFIVMGSKMGDLIAVTYTDVSERKQNEQNLKRNYNDLIAARESLRKFNNELETRIRDRTLSLTKSEERFNLVSKATNDTIWDWDLANNKIWRSENMHAMFGYKNAEQSTSIDFWFEKIHIDDRERVRNSVYDVINEDGETWSAEYRFENANGSFVDVLDRGSIQRDQLGIPYRMVGSVVDVTRIKAAERQAGESENRFRKVFESNVIGMLFSDIDGNIKDANNAILELLGYSSDEIQKQDLRWQKITPVGEHALGRTIAEQLNISGSYPAVERELLRADGSTVAVLMGAAKLDNIEGSLVVTYVIDIRKQKDAENRRRELQEYIVRQQKEFYDLFLNAPAMISIRRGEDLTYEFVNEEFTAFHDGVDFTGLTTKEANAKFPEQQLYVGDQDVITTSMAFNGQAFMVKRYDKLGSYISDAYFDFLFTPVYDEKEQVDGIAFFGFEVTELIKAQQATKELMHRKDEFMSVASHELKTPITSLKGSLQIGLMMLQQNKPNAIISQFIDRGIKQTDKLTNLINDLLDVTKIHSGKMELNYTTFDITELINEAVADIVSHTSGHEIKVSSSPLSINADRHRLEQVLINFLSNAVKYSPDGKEIIVDLTTLEDNKIRVSVQDFGIGIPASQKDLVFDRFFRVQESSAKYSGLGLGLFISKDIIERHGGYVGVESTEGEGSRFWFVIPSSDY